ncbi:MAG: 50S ribosomal protein L25 [Chitinophagales bacterium]|nr:50S ribosomal protein L25 [Chitinophagales bacterium]MCB9018893.1 50S ribosomal protein L25 [Chitinophagales bacterium]MCB9022571.1 50S ribosomal protein L25 [Chitinophagales bacterium]HPE97138.1 50S ribosomal protein L25 [Chitinophagales bacterium]HPR28984.1 50S ribosomal protein L25 [Chitinophagales bacterium]
MKTVNIEGKVRTSTGKAASNASRKQGMVPCTLYGRENNISFEVSESALRGIIYTPEFFKVNVKLDGKEYETLIKDMQFHPVTDKPLHLDFFVLSSDKKVVCEIPLQPKGLAAGVKAGGKLSQKIRKVKVKGFPKDLVDLIEVDVTHLEMGKSVRIGEIKVDNLEIMGSQAIPVITCTIPRSMRSKQSAEAAEAKSAS